MSKIPVGHTIAQTYNFAFGSYLRILGVIWLPFVLMGAIVYFYFMPVLESFPTMAQQISQHAQQNPQTPFMPEAMQQLIARMYGIDLLIYILFAVISVGIAKIALGMRTSTPFVYIDVGIRELLVLAGWIVIAIMFAVAVFVVFIVGAIVVGVGAAVVVGGGAQPTGSSFGLAGLLAGLLFIAIYCAFIYIAVRLTYLMVPATTAEGGFGVFRSWELTRGNFWRIIGIVLATILPLFVVEFVVGGVVFGPMFVHMAAEAQQHPGDPGPAMQLMMQGLGSAMIYLWALGLLISPVAYGLMLGSSAFAYRSLVPETNA